MKRKQRRHLTLPVTPSWRRWLLALGVLVFMGSSAAGQSPDPDEFGDAELAGLLAKVVTLKEQLNSQKKQFHELNMHLSQQSSHITRQGQALATLRLRNDNTSKNPGAGLAQADAVAEKILSHSGPAVYSSCEWSPWLGEKGKPQSFAYKCPNDKVMAGLQSGWQGKADHRWFQVKCCQLEIGR